MEEKMKDDIKYKFSIHDKLNEQDTESQTFGCRCNNPEICTNCYLPTCALINETHICTTPSRAWKKIYNQKKIDENK
jgi:hypothetical protein